MKLQLRHEINEQLFDELMRQSHAPAYTHTWYLDAVCGQWAALVFGDYDAVFILPHKKKWGITYLMQPDFCQQLGLWGKNTSPQMLQQCIETSLHPCCHFSCFYTRSYTLSLHDALPICFTAFEHKNTIF